MPMTLNDLRRYAIARSLFKPTTLGRAIAKLGFVQADPIRAPARAQDLTLRHRVLNYHAGDLERRYPKLRLEEDFFVNYGFLPRAHHGLLHPRGARTEWTAARNARATAILDFVHEHGSVHPREIDAHFAHGKVTNWFGGSSNASTQLLDAMHYRGMLRVARREGGTRVYAVHQSQQGQAAPEGGNALGGASAASRMDALIDIAVRKYSPLSAASLGQLVSYLWMAAPQWKGQRAAALVRAKLRLSRARIEGVDWYWPAGENPCSVRWPPHAAVRLLAPFDPVVWDRRRFEIFWGWAYRFEAYTPATKRKLGYYALPLLWRESIIGWGNVKAAGGMLSCSLGYIAGHAPRDLEFRAGLEAELVRMRAFLGLPG